jgi:hypothetical protein
MSGLYSALVAMAFTSVAWFAKGGAVVGALIGCALAYLPIARVLRAQGAAPQPIFVRRFAAVCCLLWGLILPTALSVSGLMWGLARGLGNVVEGPVSTTVRATEQTWLARANGLRAGVLGRFPLAKRLSEGELMTVVNAAPQWLSEVLQHSEAVAARQAEGLAVPPQVLIFLRDEVHTVAHDRVGWLLPAVERLRARAQGTAANWPTLQETIDAMVAPAVFQDAATAIRAKAGHFIRLIVIGALLSSALLAGALRLLWKRPAVAAPASQAKPPADEPRAESAHG